MFSRSTSCSEGSHDLLFITCWGHLLPYILTIDDLLSLKSEMRAMICKSQATVCCDNGNFPRTMGTRVERGFADYRRTVTREVVRVRKMRTIKVSSWWNRVIPHCIVPKAESLPSTTPTDCTVALADRPLFPQTIAPFLEAGGAPDVKAQRQV